MLLSVALLLSICGRWPFGARAADIQPDQTVTETDSNHADAAHRLREGLLACAVSIDLTDCRLPAAEAGALYASVLYDDPALFHVALRLSYATAVVPVGNGEKTLYDNGKTVRTETIVTTVYPTYSLTGATLAEARALYRDTIDGILSDMEAAFGGHPACEAAVALYLHDVLAERYAYDTRPSGTSVTTGETAPNADAYRFFRDGVGICQAYALAYMALGRAAGLEVCFVSSPTMNHAWNHVHVDGRWYHVDVTRDDPITASGEDVVTHTRLLRSDEGMASMGYTDFSCPAGHTCTDRRYESVEGSGGTNGAPASGGDDNGPFPPLGVFEEALTPAWTGKTLIFVAKIHGGDTVAPRWSHGEFYGENAVLEEYAAAIAAVYLTPDGVTVTAPGDLDGDGALTPGDLLCIYDPILPAWWREALREAVVRTESARGSD